MHAIILAGGKGTRLKPYTTILPKPLMPIGELPILEVILRQLRQCGFKEITIAVGYLSEVLMAFFGNGERLGLNIQYSFEDKPLGTVGPLKLVKKLPDTFLVMNGDILTTLNYKELMDYHLKKEACVSIASYNRKVNVDFGVIQVNNKKYLDNYIEKPTLDYLVSMGVYIFNKRAIEKVPEGKYFDLPSLVLQLLNEGEKVASFHFEGFWLDIGRPDDYAAATEQFEQNRDLFLYGN